MTPGITSLLFALAGFALAFVVARALAKWVNRRQSHRVQQDEANQQSRQVRRAKQRGRKRS